MSAHGGTGGAGLAAPGGDDGVLPGSASVVASCGWEVGRDPFRSTFRPDHQAETSIRRGFRLGIVAIRKSSENSALIPSGSMAPTTWHETSGRAAWSEPPGPVAPGQLTARRRTASSGSTPPHSMNVSSIWTLLARRNLRAVPSRPVARPALWLPVVVAPNPRQSPAHVPFRPVPAVGSVAKGVRLPSPVVNLSDSPAAAVPRDG